MSGFLMQTENNRMFTTLTFYLDELDLLNLQYANARKSLFQYVIRYI